MKQLILIILFFAIISNLYARGKHKTYNANIKYMDGKRNRGQLIAVMDSSLVIVTLSHDTVTALVTDIKKFNIKKKFKQFQSSFIIFGGTFLITGLYSYIDQSQGYYFGRTGSSIILGVAAAHAIGLPAAGLAIGLKELLHKKYIINGSQIKYGYVKTYLKRYLNN